jgi:hypothetical protein
MWEKCARFLRNTGNRLRIRKKVTPGCAKRQPEREEFPQVMQKMVVRLREKELIYGNWYAFGQTLAIVRPAASWTDGQSWP